MISREELYELIWSNPMTKAAAQFKVSNTYLARICSLLHVPKPPRGYWAKRAVGKAPPQTPLPEARPGDQLFWSQDGQTPPLRQIRHSPKSPQISRDRALKMGVHRLIQGAKGHFESGRPIDEDEYLRPYKKLLVDVRTSKAALDRALEFANALFNALESAGHRVLLANSNDQLHDIEIDEREDRTKKRGYHYPRLWSPYRPTIVYVGTVAIGLSVIEVSEDVVLRYVNGKYIRESNYVAPKVSRYGVDRTWTTTKELPSGRLRLVAYCPYRKLTWSIDWQETKSSRLLNSLKVIVKSIESAAVELVPKLEEADRLAEIAHQKYLAEVERYRREEDQRQVEKSIKESREHLGRIITKWSEVTSVADFLKGVDAQAAGLPEDQRAKVQERLQLAREFLGSQDPLDFFLAWKTPSERYQKKFDSFEDDCDDASESEHL